MTGISPLLTSVCPRRSNRRDLRASQWFRHIRLAMVGTLMSLSSIGSAAEGPFLITYTHQMEEPGNLEFATKNVIGNPRGGDRVFGWKASISSWRTRLTD